jgi:hypothetical protein
MNVASLGLCQELHAASAWKDQMDYVWVVSKQFSRMDVPGIVHINKPMQWDSFVAQYDYEEGDAHLYEMYPAYDLGYLLRKLPREYKHPTTFKRTIIKLTSLPNDGGGFMPYWSASYDQRGSAEQFRQLGATPEDAACKLAIELFKQGILQREVVS